MSTLPARDNVALLVIDVQNGVVEDTHERDAVVSDAHTTEDQTEWGAPRPADVIAHTNLYWSHQEAPGRLAGTAPSDEVALRP